MQRIQLPENAALGLPFCSAVRVGDMLYLSGALGNRPGSLTLVPGGIASETKQTMENIGAVLAHCGLGFSDIVKATVFLADMSEWSAFNQIYVGYFAEGQLPARSALGCSGLALGARLEIECIARFP